MKQNLSAVEKYSSPLLFHYRQVSLCTLPFHIACLILLDSDFRNFSLILSNVQGSKGFIFSNKGLGKYGTIQICNWKENLCAMKKFSLF